MNLEGGARDTDILQGSQPLGLCERSVYLNISPESMIADMEIDRYIIPKSYFRAVHFLDDFMMHLYSEHIFICRLQMKIPNK